MTKNEVVKELTVSAMKELLNNTRISIETASIDYAKSITDMYNYIYDNIKN